VSGRLVGEVIAAAPRLYAAGLSRSAVQALAPIAEGCRDESRTGTCPQARIAEWLDRSVKTAERAVAELIEAGVVVLVQRGGGRARATNRYYLMPLEAWSAAGTPDTQVSVVAARQSPLVAPVDERNSGHSDVGSSGAADAGTPDIQVSEVPDRGERNSRQNAVELPTSLDVCSPVVPVTTPGGSTDVTTGPRVVAAPSPHNASLEENTPPTAVPAESVCGRPDCRAPLPCGACGRARRAAGAREDLATGQAERAAAAAVRAAEAERRAELAAARARAEADCPLGCVGGYLGTQLCDHDPDAPARARRGRALVQPHLPRRRSADRERARQDTLAELVAVDEAPGYPGSDAVDRSQPSDQRTDVA
jgi:hypothetical protein